MNEFLVLVPTTQKLVGITDIIEENKGVIDLPLRVDLNDRPRQVVCYKHGKSGRTLWEVVERRKKHTRIHFYPITGRTHQLRIHAAACILNWCVLPVIG